MKDRAWAEIDLDNLAHNVSVIRRKVGLGVKLMPAVKADAYGHGLVPITSRLMELGCHAAAVATPEEALQLRDGGVAAPILVLGGVLPEEAQALMEADAAVNISDLAIARELAKRALAEGKCIRAHLKVDTGMGRMGVGAERAVEAAVELSRMGGLSLEGIFTHFPSAEYESEFTRLQIELFAEICERTRSLGLDIPLRHAANSAAIFTQNSAPFNAVRPGLSLYGFCGVPGESEFGLKPVMSVKSRIILLKEYLPGWTIGYGRTYTVERPMLAAVVPVGYADGYSRMLSNRGSMLARGTVAPVVGRVSMDQTVIDVTDIPGVSLGDEVVIYGDQGGKRISAGEVAESLGSIANELLCAVGGRLRRVYLSGGREVEDLKPAVVEDNIQENIEAGP